ncbi:MAG: DMT family transporter [Candidatus Marinimicrobia bacterium]|nr:DMT family transporter [Candidatus Neomarinimicrobiota bacterium]MCF7827575.1 DMT family transporter [Candidatus Neomarinimicrobiota bacterium]MCF7881563.1 DMT family transporter [Candidatus Neomarinimicrobiota bacterium]
MISLFLSVACSVLIAFILKINEVRTGNRIVVLAGNYLVATGISFVTWQVNPVKVAQLPNTIFAFAVFVGVGFVIAFFAYMKSVNKAGVGFATLVARLSIVLPLVLSGVFYSESPDVSQWIGIALTFITIAVFARSMQSDKTKEWNRESILYLFLLFTVLGLNDFAMKIFREWLPGGDRGQFLLVLFGTATLFTWGIVAIRKMRVTWSDLLLGVILGIPNMFASFFLIDALHQLPGIVVYPLANVAIIGFTVLGGIVIWRERINRLGWISLGLATIAIVLLSM